MALSLSQAINIVSSYLSGNPDKDDVLMFRRLLKDVDEQTRRCTGCGKHLTRDSYYCRRGVGKRKTSWNINQPCKECTKSKNRDTKIKGKFYDPKTVLY